MALAPYFARAALAAAQVVAGYDPDVFEERLKAQAVGVSVGGDACASPEGRAIADLAIRLMARLYPSIELRIDDEGLCRAMVALALEINPELELVSAAPIGIVVGEGSRPFYTSVFAGSDGWVARVSPDQPRSVGATRNAFGAGAAACMASAQLFRLVFLPPEMRAPDSVSFDTWSLDAGTESAGPEEPPDIGEATVIGLGAIGNGVAWSLARSGVTGELTLVDNEPIDLSNLQRYVLAGVADVGRSKVEVIGERLGCSLIVRLAPERFEAYAERTGHAIELAVIGLDSAAARRAVAASLPHKVVNAWTQPGDLGVSVHGAFGGDGACVECLYLADGRTRNEDELVADALGIPDEVRTVRQLLVEGRPVPEPLLILIADRLGIDPSRAEAFAGRPVRELYVEGLCGGALVPIAALGRTRPDMHVPLAHQSALAGVLLGAAAVRAATGDVDGTRITRLNVLSLVGANLSQRASARPNVCICRDPDFVGRFNAKWPEGATGI